MRTCIEEQRCPWCGRSGLRSLANHTVRAHQIYADELRKLAGLAPGAALCSPDLSDQHRELAREHDSHRWIHQPGIALVAAATREANYDDEQRRRRVEHLHAVRRQAIEANRRSAEAARNDPSLAAARRAVRSSAHRSLRPGAECLICAAWFCSVAPVGRDYVQRKTCSDACYRELMRRVRLRTWMSRALESLGLTAAEESQAP